MLATLGAGEVFWRAHGFRPSIQDTPGLWDAVRSRATQSGERSVALLGSSRALLGLDPGVLVAACPEAQVCQLGIDGSSPLPVFFDLANDRHFKGTVVCEVAPTMFFDRSRRSDSKSAEWVRHYHQRSRVSDPENRMRLLLQERFTVLRPELSPRNMVADIAKGRLPQAGYTRVAPSRFRFADFDGVDTAALREHWAARFCDMGEPGTADELRAFNARLLAAARQIEQRGGEVVFVRMPSSGRVAEIEEQRFPRARYWDVFAATPGIHAIHCDDEPTLGGFTCPDDSHMDGVQASRFTSSLARVLARDVPAFASAGQGQPHADMDAALTISAQSSSAP